MFNYHIKITIIQYKDDEFISSLKSLLPNIQIENGCKGYHFYRDLNERHVFIVTGDWKTLRTMEDHFQNPSFEILIGACRVLCQEFEMKIVEYSKFIDLSQCKELISGKNRFTRNHKIDSPAVL